MSFRPCKLFLFILCLFSLHTTYSQRVGINTDTPHVSAVLDIRSGDKGVLFPRLTNAEMILIGDPADGLVIYNIDENDLFMYKDEDWNPIGTGGASGHWLTTPNGIYYNNRVGIGTNNLPSKFNVLTPSDDQTGKSSMIENYYEGLTEKHGLNIFLSQEGLGTKYGIKNLVEANPGGTSPTYGIHSYVYPNSTTNPTYAIYGEVLDDGPGEKWAGYFEGDARVSKMLRVGNGTGFEQGLFRVMNDQESTAGYINQLYNGSDQANGLSINVGSAATGHQYGLTNLMFPNGDASKTSVGISTSVPAIFGTYGAANKTIIGFEANMYDNVTQGNKYGVKVFAPGAGNWAAHLNGRTYIAEKTRIGGDPASTMLGALHVNNDDNTAAISNLHIENDFTSNCWTGIQNNFTASNSISNSYYGTRTSVVGGGVNKNIYGHFISVSGAVGNKTGLYVNAPGSTNWASYFNGRSYISESLLVGTLIGATGYKLSVDGKIACEEVRVEMSGAWPDYVFQNDYDLKSLEEVEKAIQSEGHLPGIPAAKEIENSGLELGDMQKRMMEKIEELTLYIIELNKENKRLNARLSNLENK